MALHPAFLTSPYAPLVPERRWFPADEMLRDTAYEKLLPPLVAKIRDEVRGERGAGVSGVHETTAVAALAQRGLELQPLDFEERWTGANIFENEWQSFRKRRSRELELTSARHTYAKAGRYVIAVKVIDIFGNDTMTRVPVTVG